MSSDILQSLKQRTINSSSWFFVGHIFSQLIRFTSNLLLTRLLVPEMFGVMAIAYVFLAGVVMFSDIGLMQNVVQSKRGEDTKFLNTAWTIQIVRGGVIFTVILLIALLLYWLGSEGMIGGDNVYANPQLPFVLAAISLTALIAGFDSIHLMVLNRKLTVSKIVIIDLTSQIISTTFMILWAWYYRDIWALVSGSIVGALVKMGLSHYLKIGQACRIHWDISAVHEIVNFGKWIFWGSIFGFLLSQGDKLMLGVLVTPETLGIYSIAFFLAMALKEGLLKIASSAFFPMLSEVARTEPKLLQKTYYKIRTRVDFIALPVAGLLSSSGHLIIDLFYDERYVEAGWMFETLSLSIIFVGYSMAGMCLMAKGNSKSSMVLTMITAVTLYITVPISFYYYGLSGAVFAIALNYIVDIPSSLFMMKKEGLLDLKKEVMLLPIFFITYALGSILTGKIG